MKFLIPNNDAQPGSITVTGTSSGTATPHAGTWILGDLEDFLGYANASLANPIGAYLPSTQAFDHGATGFIVYTVNVGTCSLPVPGAGTPPDRFQVTGFIAPVGSYAVADLTVAGEAVRDVATTPLPCSSPACSRFQLARWCRHPSSDRGLLGPRRPRTPSVEGPLVTSLLVLSNWYLCLRLSNQIALTMASMKRIFQDRGHFCADSRSSR